MDVRNKTAALLFCLVSLICGCAHRVAAQTPTPITQARNVEIAFTNLPCASTPASFSPTDIGQTSSNLIYISTGVVNTMKAEIDGNPDGGASHWRLISNNPVTATDAGDATASTWFPFLRGTITCTGAGTVSAWYISQVISGTTPAVFNFNGNFQTPLATGANIKSVGVYNLSSPNGSTAGTITFTCSNTCPVSWSNNPTISVFAGPDVTHLSNLLQFSPVQNISPFGFTQAFNVPNIAATVIQVIYVPTSDGVTGTYDMTYNFGGNPPSQLGPLTAPKTLIPCDKEAAFTQVLGAAGVVSLVQQGQETTVRVCHIDFSLSTAVTWQITQEAFGCTGGGIALTGVNPAVSTSIVRDYGPYAPLFEPVAGPNPSDPVWELCLRLGGAVTVGGTIIYATGVF